MPEQAATSPDNSQDSQKIYSVTINLPANVITKIITAISSKIVTLIVFILLSFALFFLYISITAESLVMSDDLTVDVGGRIVAGFVGTCVGLGTSAFSIWYLYHTTIEAEKSQLNMVSAVLGDLLAKERATLSGEISQKILAAIEQLYQSKSEVKPIDIYQKLVDMGVIHKEHHESFSEKILESENLF